MGTRNSYIEGMQGHAAKLLEQVPSKFIGSPRRLEAHAFSHTCRQDRSDVVATTRPVTLKKHRGSPT